MEKPTPTEPTHVVLACGGYIGWLFWPISAATVPVATFVMVTEPLGDRLKNSIRVPYAVSDIQTPTNYYRPLSDGRLMWGGRILTWQPGAARLARGLRRDMVSFYPDLVDARVEVAWGGLMGFHRHRLPVIGRLADGVWCVRNRRLCDDLVSSRGFTHIEHPSRRRP